MKTNNNENNALEFIWKIAILIFIMTSSTVMMNKLEKLDKRLTAVEQTLEVK